MSQRRIQVIINPASGANQPILNTLNDVFKDQGVDWQVSVTHQVGDGERFARQALDDGVDLVAVYGGDGTVMEVARGMLDSPVPLAVLPGGTGNAVCAQFGIGQQLRPAVALIADDKAEVRAVDVGQTSDGAIFLLRAVMGVAAEMSAGASRELKDQFGVLAYVASTVEAVTQSQAAHYKLDIDGETVETEAVACVIANIGTIGKLGIRLSRHILPDDGLLNVLLIKPGLQGLLNTAVEVAPMNISEWVERDVSLHHFMGQRIRIETEPARALYLDGETYPGEEPYEIHIRQEALRLLVPQASAMV